MYLVLIAATLSFSSLKISGVIVDFVLEVNVVTLDPSSFLVLTGLVVVILILSKVTFKFSISARIL
jgi:hypothetical protein